MKRFWTASAPRRLIDAMNTRSVWTTITSAFVLVFGLVFVLVAGIANATTASASAKHKSSINRLLDRSGMKEMIEGFANSARDQMAARSTTTESEEEKHVQEIFKSVFAAEIIRNHVVDALVRDYDPVHVAALERWFDSELGGKIRDEETHAQLPEATPALLEFAKTSESQPPNPDRLDMASKINQARGASALSKRLVAEILRGMIAGTAVVSQVEGHTATAAEVDIAVASQTEQLDTLLDQQMIVSFLFSGRNFSLSDNRKYLAFLESPAGQWFYSRSGEGLETAMVLAGSAFGNHAAAWLQDLRGKASPENTEERRTMAAKEGREFARSKPPLACVDKVYERRKACTQDACFADALAFGTACFASAKRTPELCRAVPGIDDLAATVYWRLSRCEARGTPNGWCDAAVGVLQNFCVNGSSDDSK